ncbi:oxidoreductase [Glaciihabitans sp. UYNi722]|uniref:oxidoreductase n=1 Tax=Glaciihabitans sp. UYNi722 TaxID=3156344 RepID=UPI003395EFD4
MPSRWQERGFGMSIPDQTGRTVIVTGGSSGIGRAAAAAFAKRGARVILAVRNQDQGRAAAADMPGAAESRPLDLGSLDSIRAFARGVEGPIDILINNAGTMTSTLKHTSDGFESQFGVNHLGHFALTNLLLGQITGRVVTTSSSLHRNAHIDFDDLQWKHRSYVPFGAYGQSKLASLLFSAELQRRLTAAGSHVIATAADPGWVSTGFIVTTGNRLRDAATLIGTKMLAQRPEAGVRPTLLAATGDVPADAFTAARLLGIRGAATLVARSDEANDPAIAKRLWEISEQLTKVTFPRP